MSIIIQKGEREIIQITKHPIFFYFSLWWIAVLLIFLLILLRIFKFSPISLIFGLAFTLFCITKNSSEYRIWTHSVILLTNGHLYTCGLNDEGQLGRSTRTIANYEFMKIDFNLGKIVDISCGAYHTTILLSNGKVYTCGHNEYGQLGRNSNKNYNPEFKLITPTPLVGKVIQISCGYFHTLILSNNGNVYTCGDNQYGQLGRKTSDNCFNPEFVIINSNFLSGKIKKISSGVFHTALLLENKKVYTCGYNFYGQLGNGSTTSSDVFNIISNNIKVKEISCGATHTSILSLDGKVYTCGNNTHNQLGKITPTIQNPEFTIINTAFIRNIKLSSLSSGCGSNLVFVLY